MKKRSHKFTMKVSFHHAVTRREALNAVRDSGQFGKGSTDYYSIYSDRDLDGEMKITGLSLAPEKKS